MLVQLRIRNLALAEDVLFEPGTGLNFITGETGAGKSLLMGALSLLLGDRSDRQMIRSGESECSIEAVFELSDSALIDELLEGEGLDACPDGELCIRRRVSVDGPSRSHVNGSPVRAQFLRKLGQLLVDMHGPHDHQSLLHLDIQRQILDDFCGVGAEVEQYSAMFSRWRHVRETLDRLRSEDGARMRELDMVRFQLKEIEEAELQPDEEEEIRGLYDRMANSTRILELSGRAAQLLSAGEDGTVFDMLVEVHRMIQELAELDDRATAMLEEVEGIQAGVEELSRGLEQRLDVAELDPERMSELEHRLDQIHRLKRKYGGGVSEILQLADELRVRMEELDSSEERIEALEHELTELDARLTGAASELFQKRSTGGEALAQRVCDQLATLGFPQAVFEVRVGRAGRTAHGEDSIELFLAPNPGEDLRPLRLVASSGEVSRVMLAIKVALAAQDRVPVLVFDEVDANVGGEVAVRVGEKLRELAVTHQVLCISHLPQVAALGDHHFQVSKEVREGRTRTRLQRLDETGRIDEITRMLGGGSADSAVGRHARELVRGGPSR
ncbi:MAG TPA: DNA repair protein RecN [Verrucomicrobia bacterium]|nr:DNA repair protein RecN [Verrucomicrobiota bacterium]